jgi:hypothetical protein
MAPKQGPNVIFCKPNRTNSILLVSVSKLHLPGRHLWSDCETTTQCTMYLCVCLSLRRTLVAGDAARVSSVAATKAAKAGADGGSAVGAERRRCAQLRRARRGRRRLHAPKHRRPKGAALEAAQRLQKRTRMHHSELPQPLERRMQARRQGCRLADRDAGSPTGNTEANGNLLQRPLGNCWPIGDTPRVTWVLPTVDGRRHSCSAETVHTAPRV